MSEEINASHLCTTEDAFEKFQAVSMYEEDEYINLSDIVSTQAQAPDLMNEICDIPYEDEVVLESILEEQVHEVNSTNETGFDENKMSGPSDDQSCEVTNAGHNETIEAGLIDVPEAGHIDVPEAGHNNTNEASLKDITEVGKNDVIGEGPSKEMAETVQPRPRRGRKKKIPLTDSAAGNDLNNGTKEVAMLAQDKEQCDDAIKTPGQRRRGRPPKQRGRPKKYDSDQQMSEKSLSSDADIPDSVCKGNESVMNPAENLLLSKEPQKRVKRKRLLSSEKSDIDFNECKDVLKPNSNDVSQNQPYKRSSGKRGRPKKKISEVMDLNVELPKPSNTELQTEKDVSLLHEDDDADDVCLSKLKTSMDLHESIIPNESMCELTEKQEADKDNKINEFKMELKESEDNTPTADLSTAHDKIEDSKKNFTMPDMTDFEYNIDNIISVKNEKAISENDTIENDADPNSLLVEDTSKRPTRRRARKPLQYDEGSDEDPFANVELSDDEPIGCKKKYYSDEEYIPGKNKNGKRSETSDSDSDIDLDSIEELTDNKRKRTYKKSEGSPTKGAKRGRKSVHEKASEESPLPKPETGMDDDIEVCLKPSIIKTNDDKKNKELESFLAKKIQGTDIKIKKKSSVQPLEIPVIDPNERKKTTENSTQTKQVSTSSAGVQTAATYDIPMKDNVTLTTEQSEKACEFLNSIVKTTAELGELMTQKSKDFIKKKINIENVTDTFKMDYCVRKSFLLFKLAKHNLMQMEEDLAQQYDTFLNTHNLQQHREQPKVVTAASKAEGSDSDCEIIEAPVIQKPQKKKEPAAFNPKTVFLNKELSIKIAKKTPAKEPKPEEKKINIKGRHTVWINDSVMVKKVKPTQSFLAQDSRNKKPPDYVTLEMVNSFFKQYYRQKALAACAPYVSTEWLAQKTSMCCFFFANADEITVSNGIPSSSGQCVVAGVNSSDSNANKCENSMEDRLLSPKTLFSLCTQVLQNHLHHTMASLGKINELKKPASKQEYNPITLYGLCVNTINILNFCQEGALKDLDCAPVSKTLSQKENHEGSNCVSASIFLVKEIYDDAISASSLTLLDQEEVYAEANCASPLNQDRVYDNLECELPSTLKTLCHTQIVKQMFTIYETEQNTSENTFNCDTFTVNLDVVYDFQKHVKDELLLKIYHTYSVKSLFSICFDLICSHMISEAVLDKHIQHNTITKKVRYTPKTLKCLTFKCIADLMKNKKDCAIIDIMNLPKKVKTLFDLCFEIVTKSFSNINDSTLHEGLTINSINTLTEEAYHNIQHAELAENSDYFEDDDSNFYDDETESGLNNLEDNNSMVDNNWLSQVQMKELRSYYTPNILLETENNIQESTNLVEAQHLVSRVKTEPVDEFQENIDSPVIVKTEPLSHNPDEMTVIPENIITKTEYVDATVTSRAPIQRQDSSSYDVNTFEAFVSTNKMMHNLNEYSNDDDEIFSQSALRIRRQFEPDDLSESDMGMSLLVPQTFEPLRIENNAKDHLMESSSDESTNSKKVPGKKKTEKRPRGKPKKNDSKSGKGPVIVPPKEKPQATNEIAMLTRKMREKIRQEEKKVVTSESDNESESIVAKKSKQKEEKNKSKSSKVAEEVKDSQSAMDMQNTEPAEIQCSNVDSTEQISEGRNASPSVSNFTGFTALDQNEISSYHKYVKYVYDQILPKVTKQAESKSLESGEPSVINPEDPVELLECEPSIPFFSEAPSNVKRKPGPKTKTQNINDIKKTLSNDEEKNNILTEKNKKYEPYIDRHGWKCYPLDSKDTKLYQNAQILLEKLPETFVQTYFMYQDITSKNDEDEEVERLINLQTLNRSIKEGKSNKGKLKSKIIQKSSEKPGSEYNIDRSRSISPTFSENVDELTPSEDEGGKIEEEVPPPIAKPTSDNYLAKNSLMDDNDSETESGVPKIKEELLDDYDKSIKGRSKKMKSKTKVVVQVPSGPVMLTADKMMNKELNLLHAPINLDDTVEPTPSKGRAIKHKQKSGNKTSPKEHGKAEDDSSSEEEKHQWFTIKEKLLKRMVKKSDTTREDDAKRAKLVSEFIERRGDSSEAYIKRRGGRGRLRRVSKKKMLERQKQLKVLTRELFGDPSNDASLHPKRSQQAYFKGRRNIRKVIDKKSLARSTVVANMEEFERKRRINIRQSRLREIMQCEDGVNVLVINDEVCLEYDFEAHRPVVTIHPFFTKVMKAHQYEGVKFMWDACFESLESIAAGHPGGGCILAHCMGLGKTLQVLALLHTVLTHPRVGMQRVLVCCPLSTVLNWVDEIHKWIGPVTNQIKVFELSKLKKTSNRAYQLEDWYNGGGIFIIGYELFRSLTTLDPFLDDVRPAVVKKIRNALLDPGPDIIICDEGHLLKNDCSVLAVAMSRVVTKRRIVLTGTPMQNNLREYYCMVNFVKPNLLGTYSEYSNRFENPIMNGQHRDSQEEDIKLMKARTHILHKVLEGCLQRQEASVLYPYLPKKHEYTVFISLTKCQWDLYKHYLQNYSHTQNNKSVLKDFHILQKIWTHPQVLHNFQNRTGESTRNKVKEEKLEDDLAREDLNATEDIKPPDTEVWWLQYLEGGAMLDSLASSNKFAAVFRILEESIALQDKVLLFSTSLYTMDALEYFLKKINNWSLGQEYYRLDGSVPAEVRQKWCREFNAENNYKTKLFLISTRAGCLGLNMTAANRVIILDTSWNPAHDIQSIFRVYRFGQKKDCYIYRLVALGTMEQKIYERSVTKQAVACRVVDEQQIDRHYNMADLTELYKYDETGVGVAGGVAVGVEDVVLLRVARDSALHAVHEHDSLLRGSLEQGLPEHERDAAWVQFQEEHAHKQEMQEMPKLVKIKKVKVASHAPPEPIGRPHTDTNWSIVKTENEESILPNDPDFTPEPVRPKPKGKKGRPGKSNVVSCCIPIQPEAPEAEDPSALDEDMVKKITHILIKHNYQNNQGPHEIAKLVSRVRSLVYSGNMDQLDSSDELTMSIARVLLGRDARRAMPPPLTNIVTDPEKSAAETIVKQEYDETPEAEETPKAAPKSRGRPRKKQATEEKKKKGYVYEAVPSTSNQPQPDPDSECRTRRRAALAAEKNFESLPVGDPVIDIEDDESGDNEFLPEMPIEYDATPDAGEETDSADEIVFSNIQIKTENTDNNNVKPSKKPPKIDSKKDDSNITDTKQRKKNTPASQSTSLNEQSSILLSDDEEYAPPAHVARKKPGPARKTIKSEMVESQATSCDSFEPVPLHPSLLSNKNFIKIVAHTYLSGNPMLDEDAATLAAQYSTFKALKEFEANGRNIESGPIYDIAIKVLGIDVLRKLHNSNVRIATSDMLAQHPINSQDATPAKDTPANSAVKQALNVHDKKKSTQSMPGRKITLASLTQKYTPEHSAQKTTPTQSAQKSKTEPSVQKPSPPVLLPVTPVEPSLSEKKPVKIKLRIPASAFRSASNFSTVPLTAAPATPANVVPVGLFKGAAEVPASESQSGEECILPDDDDIRIVTDPAPPAARRQPPDTPHVYPVTVYSVPPGADSATRPVPPTDYITSNNTISLDSDDEEPPPAPAAPQGPVYVAHGPAGTAPVPVSLTAVHPSAIPLHIRPSHKPKILRKIVPLSSTAHSVGKPILLNSSVDTQAGASEIVPGAGQFVLLPGPGAPPVVPVAISKVQYKPHPQTHPIRTNADSSNLSDVIQVDLQDNNPLDYIGAEQTVESTVPESTAQKGSKRVCKPGDILRITKGGEIEVLNRKDITKNKRTIVAAPAERKPPPPPSAPVQTRTLRGSTAPTPIAPKVSDTTKPGTTPKPDQNPYARTYRTTPTATATDQKRSSTGADNSTKASSSTVTAIESRSPSPNDIFKNVVHIEADNYASRVSSPSTPAKDAPKKPNTSNRNFITINSGLVTNIPSGNSSTTKTQTKLQNPISHTPKTPQTSAKESASNTKASTSNTKPSTSNPKPLTSNAKTSGSNATPQKSSLPTRNAPSKVTPASNKAKELVMDSVDLTDLDYLPPVSLNSNKKSKPQTTTIVGTSKSIILCASGKAVSKAGASTSITTTAKPAPKVDKVTPAVKTEVKKRPAPVDNSLAKKKKTDKPMTLKDFNLDDIDDIIELD